MISVVEFSINLISSLGYWGVLIGMTHENACRPIPNNSK